MKRKIAAIMAADIAGYSRLVAENEEATLQQLASYREVFDDFVSKAGGRIFNTAGDAILAEFSSAVEAVRSTIDIQECLRSRNTEYPLNRQMNFRIGITIGDVVERDGDLLGDGVNIAARLQSVAEPGGISVSRAVYEQVSNKVSLQFIDLGQQGLKNISTPVHVYMIAMHSSEQTAHAGPPTKAPANRYLTWPALLICGAILASLGYMQWADQQVESKVESSGQVPLQHDELAKLLIGKSVTYGSDGIATYHRDGSYAYQKLSTQGISFGTYQISDGKVCVSFKAGDNRCDEIVKKGDQYLLINSRGTAFPIQ